MSGKRSLRSKSIGRWTTSKGEEEKRAPCWGYDELSGAGWYLYTPLKNEQQLDALTFPSTTIDYNSPKREPAPREGSNKRFYNLAEAAAFLNVSKGLIYKLTGSKRIPYFKVGSRVMFSEEQLLGWVAGFEHLAEEPSPRGTRRN